jgi:uncharacterized repeat protein (TIGR03803 family)
MNRRESAFRWSVALAIFATILLCPTASTQTFAVIHNFGGPGISVGVPLDGANPYAGLVFDSQGNLYGTTARGGLMFCLLDGCGMVFELKPHSGADWSEKVLTFFEDGGTPVAPVVFDRRGNVYGTFACHQDCFNRYGGVFELIPRANGGWTQVTLTDPFEFRECQNGVCGVAFDNTGHLYGTSQESSDSQGGVAFSLNHPSVSSWYPLILYSFTGGDDGGGPSIEFSFDGSNNIYGTTYSGGAYGNGTVFKLTQNGRGSGWVESVLYSFQGGSDGANPNGGVVFDAEGNLYGTTVNGGTAAAGTVFKLMPQSNGSWSETVLYSFQSGSDATNPGGPLTFDGAGDLYGVAPGGAHGHGAVFKLTRSSGGHWNESLVYSFTGGLDGDSPSGGVIFDSAGNLYGTTVYGGAYPTCSDEPYCGGVAYEITP